MRIMEIQDGGKWYVSGNIKKVIFVFELVEAAAHLIMNVWKPEPFPPGLQQSPPSAILPWFLTLLHD